MKLKVHAHWVQENWEPEPKCYLSTNKMTDFFPEYIYAGEFEIELPIEPPSRAEIVNGKVAALRKEQGVLIHKADLIEEKIKQLMCIEYKPEAIES